MYRAFFGIENKPFSIVPDPRFFFLSEKHSEALAHLLFGIEESGGFVLLTGEVGTGKTLVSRRLVADLADDIELALCLNPNVSDLELLATICDELGIDRPAEATSRKDLIDRINTYLLEAYAAGRRVVLVIDEAQDLPPETLEQVRLLTNLETETTKLLQIVLIGQQELLEVLERPEMRQVNQRITARYHLMPLTRDETRAYIRHRLAVVGLWPGTFRAGAIKEVHRASRGVPRLINTICDRCLMAAYVRERKTVDARTVRRAAAEVLGGPVRPQPRRERRRGLAPWLAGAAGAAALAGGLVIADPLDRGWDRFLQAGDWLQPVIAVFADPAAPQARQAAAEERGTP